MECHPKKVSLLRTLAWSALGGALLTAAPVQAAPLCDGGEVIRRGTVIVGCRFPRWGANEQLQCNGAQTFLPNPGGTCYVCVDSVEGAVVSNPSRWAELNISGAPASFNCLGGYCTALPEEARGWYPLDESVGPTASDIVGLNPGRHVNGPVPVAGKVGNALRFDGIDDYVEAPSAPSNQLGTGDLSIEAWVRTSSANYIQMIVDKRDESSFPNIRGYGFYVIGGQLGLQLADGAGYSIYGTSGVSVSDGQWHLVAVTVDRDNPSGGRFWLDGALVGTFDPTVRPGSFDSTKPLRIGSRSTFVTGIFQGDIDEVSLHGRALLPAELAAHYQTGAAGRCRPACIPTNLSMNAWYPLDEIVGPTASDIIAWNPGRHVNGPVPVVGKVGNALRFDGINDYVEAPSAPTNQMGSGDLSIDAWVRTSQISDVQMIVDKREETVSSNVRGYGFYLYNRQLGFQLADGAGYSIYGTSGVNVSDGRWHHVAVTVDRDNASGGRFWLDGVLVGTFDPRVRPGSLDSTRPLRIGSRSTYVTGIFNGDIDEVAMHNRVLTPADISAIHQAGRGGRCK
ncbi:LamG domain-containing protein [Pyxidicoccus sp. MSG2]|uniref:LamG domain-containing protein n=1 Tax=Pyxidicoccus sp. MSG2 TaxID=2996790 RepID=UPI002270C2C2|nr:LamG domain-containing protein [Pyxidicoccus sp. MSG2]MCY1022715.1 LamG domain-containing protein [Pyxidicoccus sp. MSG2]